MSNNLESPVTPGHPDYRKYLGDNLLLRWSTPADRAGCAMVSSMAWSVPEGAETDRYVRVPERMAMSEYYWGDPSAWAVCVGLSGPRSFPRTDSASQDSPYVARLRQEAGEAKEPVIALIHYKVMKWAFERSTCEVDVLKSWIVACRTDSRAAVGAGNIVKELFEMVHNRGQLLGVAFFHINGIPSYYRNHGYEYAYHFGRHFSTTISELPNLPAPPMLQPSATHGIKSPDTLELSSTSPDGSARSVPQQHYRLRQATPLDTPVLVAMLETGRARSDVWVSLPPDLLEGAVAWAVNPREPPFAELAEDVAPPVWVLEKIEPTDSKGYVVAAVGLKDLLDPKETKPIARVTRLLWDEKADASITVSELVTRMVPAANGVLEATAENIRQPIPHVNTETSNIASEGGKVDNLPPLNTQLAYIDWYLAEGHPLKPWLIANRLAEEKPDPPFEVTNDWLILIPSLSHFISQLKPALNARLSRFEHMLGKSFGCELLITAYNRSYLGVRIHIQECAILNVEAYSAETPRPAKFGKREPNVPNMCAPRGSLMQLFMGYSSWQEITRRVPDAIAAPHITPVINILFPKVIASSHVYF